MEEHFHKHTKSPSVQQCPAKKTQCLEDQVKNTQCLEDQVKNITTQNGYINTLSMVCTFIGSDLLVKLREHLKKMMVVI
ncbi:hypothetical protein NY2A_b603L [Paramecium bursaria Chlorella virus NY2A]|uniref:Uncharacterized protein b603L n=1 Tax=Paramecium bursaria Chlorella virus NY2A TaxID=46021 RepID=A7IXC8_PBCVN|nr:hypothetical protein NY2A_b603L [Paramecium bursaria Chlorella virus NY2A]YP_001498629.1 hypothetical protein AR158_c548L [Paramecium bursaria Chlorella virus AR158]ABT15002.1 hypothetical protein NY2A_b603L [Paramecium bursaria Chlorella virus NY2A]ABU44093.1 hypothetical protein AR158_c548L [Paramecium bursaria Chlorella virus AR158]